MTSQIRQRVHVALLLSPAHRLILDYLANAFLPPDKENLDIYQKRNDEEMNRIMVHLEFMIAEHGVSAFPGPARLPNTKGWTSPKARVLVGNSLVVVVQVVGFGFKIFQKNGPFISYITMVQGVKILLVWVL
jgi:hypothetical protein